ncbi:MAG TPA: sensor histidine kinase [Nitrospiraceae bacterium]|nr:sensor histidine kinase [Nitrospiraceae bacterium]
MRDRLMRAASSKLPLLLVGGSAGALLTGLSLHALWPDWRWHQEPVHSTMEALGGLTSIATAAVLLHSQQTFTVLKWRTVAVGLLGMGLLQIFHAMAEPGHAFVFLRNVASLTGSIGFVLTWLGDEPDRPSRTTRWLWMIPAGAFALGAWGLLFPEQLPEMMRNGELTAQAVAPQGLACLCFFAGTVRFFLDYKRSAQAEDLLFTFLPLLFGLAEVVFLYSVPWGASWWFWHGLGLIACSLLLIYLSRGYLRMVDELTSALNQATRTEQTLRRSEQQLRQAIDERERMAEDLHDGVIQSVFAIGLNLERCRRLVTTEPEESMTQLGVSIADLKRVIRDLRGYLVGLEPSISNGQEFEATLTSLVNGMNGSGRLRYTLRFDPEAAKLITGDQTAHLVSIAREAMSNSLRHSGASAGTLSFGLSEEGVRLVVEDNGVGFEVSCSPQQGHGLKNMQARAKRVGGRLDVRSDPGQGTTVICTIPILSTERKHASS